MDFDEYDYLEKTVENPEPEKSKDKINGNGETVKSEGGERRRSSKHKSEESGNDINTRSKRVKSRDERGDRDRERGDRDKERGDRDRERGSSHHHSSTRDVERSERSRRKSNRDHKDREKESEREERNGKDKYIEKEKEKEKDHEQEKRVRNRENDKEKEKDREREKRAHDRENDKEKDRESGRDRSHRSSSRSERQKDEPDREKHQGKERSRDTELREREKEKEPKEPERDNRRHKLKREDQDVDPERDQRTVFAYQICLKADERDVYEFFSRAGKVRDVRLIMDRNSRRSKGFGYIEFYDSMSVPMAIALSGQTLLSSQVMVKPSEAEKNLVQSTASAAGGLTGPYSGGARRLYVGNLHFNIREDQLRQVFEAFGSVELVQLPLDQETGHCKGYGFVQFARLEDARAAESLNGQLEIAGRAIKVSAITDQAGMQDIGVNPGDFDDDEGGGLTLNASSRAILMQKLDRSGTSSSITSMLGNPAVNGLGSQPTVPVLGTVPTVSSLAGLPVLDLPVPPITVPSVDIVGVPSECLLLKNMFDPNIESEPDFDLDIEEDVQAECSKYGTLKHIFVDKNTQGFVYLRFDNTQAASEAQRALHGRWFAQKMITATFMVPQTYESKFPDSK